MLDQKIHQQTSCCYFNPGIHHVWVTAMLYCTNLQDHKDCRTEQQELYQVRANGTTSPSTCTETITLVAHVPAHSVQGTFVRVQCWNLLPSQTLYMSTKHAIMRPSSVKNRPLHAQNPSGIDQAAGPWLWNNPDIRELDGLTSVKSQPENFPFQYNILLVQMCTLLT